MLQINQVYYCQYESKTHKYYNYLRRLIKGKVFTKVIKMPSWRAWVQRTSSLIKSGGKRKCFYPD